jgi:predicted dehydrogenase
MGTAHCKTLESIRNAKLVGVWDIRAEATQKAAETFGVKGYESQEALLDAVDGVFVVTMGFSHAEPVIAAAEAGVHVMVEKPLGANLADCDRMIEASDRNKVILMVGQVLRFYPCHEVGMKLVKEGDIGDIINIETDYSGPYRGKRERPDNWFGKMGGLLENGVHKSDLINWFGGKAKTVAAEVGSFSGRDDWEDYTITLIRYESGAMGILRWGSFMGARGSRDTYIDGTLGSLDLRIGGQRVLRKKIGESDWTELDVPNRNVNTVLAEDQHFVDCMIEGKPPIVDGRDGRAAVELALATYESARSCKKVQLPLKAESCPQAFSNVIDL